MEELKVSVKVILSSNDKNNQGSFGPGIAYLLEGIKETGSLNQATKNMNMAYSKAWTIIKESEEMLGYKLIERYPGSKGSKLTKKGEDILNLYYEIKNEIMLAANDVLEKYK
ncbi:MAG: LysR family transcriptional regulator [Tissierellia bacterium]|nr:LysR family transcriptional regulator [Tissierellia bacterium]